MTKIIISNNPAALAAELRKSFSTATVEAEYGANVVEGSLITLAHHGDRADQPCPCLGDNLNGRFPVISRIGVSHFDLDTLGGVMRVLGCKDYDPQDNHFEFDADEVFWEVAARIDVSGPHKLYKILADLRPEFLGCFNGPDRGSDPGYGSSIDRWNDHVKWIRQSLNAFWAWSEKNRLVAPRDGSVQDCTGFFREAIRVLTLILEDCGNKETEALLQAGIAWSKAKEALDDSSFVAEKNGVILRRSDNFTNHLYRDTRAVVAFNEKFKSVTLSFESQVDKRNACEIVQALWGKDAGGHKGIAGSPRGKEMTFKDAEVLFGILTK